MGTSLLLSFLVFILPEDASANVKIARYSTSPPYLYTPGFWIDTYLKTTLRFFLHLEYLLHSFITESVGETPVLISVHPLGRAIETPPVT
jgi:hypothetical protein